MHERDASEFYMDMCVDRLLKAGMEYSQAKEIQKWCGCTRSELKAMTDLMIDNFNKEKEKMA